jgi:hypothetical protein
MLPARQRFEARNGRADLHLRLVIQRDLAFGDRGLEIPLHRAPFPKMRVGITDHEVEAEHRKHLVVGRGLFDGRAEMLGECRTVRQIGQCVVMGQMRNSLLVLLSRGDVLGNAEQILRLIVVTGNRKPPGRNQALAVAGRLEKESRPCDRRSERLPAGSAAQT